MSTDKNKETVENNQQSIEEQEKELLKRFPSVTKSPAKQLLSVLLQVVIVIALIVIFISSIIREYKDKDSQITESKEYIATVVDKYATAGLTDTMNYVIEVKTDDNSKFVLYISNELWNTVEEDREYKLVISNTKLREGKVSLELIEDTTEKESNTEKETK